MSFASVFNAAVEFLALRFPVEKMDFHSMVEKKEVPIHHMSWGYYTGGLTLFFFVIQVITGFFLLFYYQATVSDANLSVEHLTRDVACGDLIRNMHAWTSSAMILMAAVHMLTAFAMKAYEKPREIVWIAGVILLAITMTMGFTGYLLPWNQIAVNATKVGLQCIENIGQYLPPQVAHLPGLLKETFQGEASVGQSTLGRFYAMHIVLLPMVLVALLGLHLLGVQLHGMSQGIDEPAKRSEKFFTIFFIKDLSLWAGVFFVLFVLSRCLPFDALLPYPLLAPYNPLGSTPPGIKPEWYFYFVYYPLELLPYWVILLAGLVIGAVVFCTPWIFKNTSRKALGFITAGISAYLIIMTLYGHIIYEYLKPE